MSKRKPTTIEAPPSKRPKCVIILRENFLWKSQLVCLGEEKLLRDIFATGWPDDIKARSRQVPTQVLPLLEAAKMSPLYKQILEGK